MPDTSLSVLSRDKEEEESESLYLSIGPGFCRGPSAALRAAREASQPLKPLTKKLDPINMLRLTRQLNGLKKVVQQGSVLDLDTELDGPTPERFLRSKLLKSDAGVLVYDRDGRPERTDPYRSIDLLGSLLKRGDISKEQAAAGVRFRAAFHRANLDSLKAADPARTIVSGIIPQETDSQATAHESVRNALASLGNPDSKTASVLWHVIGCELSLRDWCMIQRWQVSSRYASTAKGILIAALESLTTHYANADKDA